MQMRQGNFFNKFSISVVRLTWGIMRPVLSEGSVTIGCGMIQQEGPTTSGAKWTWNFHYRMLGRVSKPNSLQYANVYSKRCFCCSMLCNSVLWSTRTRNAVIDTVAKPWERERERVALLCMCNAHRIAAQCIGIDIYIYTGKVVSAGSLLCQLRNCFYTPATASTKRNFVAYLNYQLKLH